MQQGLLWTIASEQHAGCNIGSGYASVMLLPFQPQQYCAQCMQSRQGQVETGSEHSWGWQRCLNTSEYLPSTQTLAPPPTTVLPAPQVQGAKLSMV